MRLSLPDYCDPSPEARTYSRTNAPDWIASISVLVQQA
jgi:hypothetical protein